MTSQQNTLRWRRFSAFALAGMLCTVAPSSRHTVAAAAQQKFKVDVDLVNIFLTVQDSGGGFVKGLTAEDFRIYEDGVEQKVSAFEKEDVPSTVGVLIDNSLSMVDILPAMKVGLLDFAKRKGTFNELFVTTFGTRTLMIHDFGQPIGKLDAELKPIKAQGTSVLFDALVEGMDKLSTREPQRKALIVFTDGFDTASKAGYKQVLLAAQKTGVLLYFIPIGSRVLIDETTLESLARETGGRVFYVPRFQPVSPAMDDIRQDLARQYYLGYYGTRTPGFHAIRLEVPKREVRIRAKSGYYGS